MKIRDWYFQGWERRADEQGKKQFYYTGEYYRFRDGIRPVRLHLTAAAVVLTALYLLLTLCPTEGGMWRIAAIPQLLELIPLIYLMMAVVRLLANPEKMNYRQYHASWLRGRRSLWWSGGFCAVCAAVELVFLLSGQGVIHLISELLWLAGWIIAALLSFFCARYLTRQRPDTFTE